MFKDFPEVNIDNEETFKYVINCIAVQFLEQDNLFDSALEFPACIDGTGRSHVHSLCNFLGLASHSQGTGTKRRIIIYRKHLNKDKQAKEAKDKEKERQKLMIKLKESNFPPQIPEVPISTRDRMIKECWCEI